LKRNKVGFKETKSETVLISRRKNEEAKEIIIYVNINLIKQFKTINYLGKVIDDKFKFSQHMSHAADRCRKVVFKLSKCAKIHWGIRTKS